MNRIHRLDALPSSVMPSAVIFPHKATWAGYLRAIRQDVRWISDADAQAGYQIDLAFVDIAASDQLMQRLRPRCRRVICINSCRDNERAEHLLERGLCHRLLQLPLRQRVVDGIIQMWTETVASVAKTRERLLFLTADVLLAETMRDEMEPEFRVVSRRGYVDSEAVLRREIGGQRFGSIFVDLAYANIFVKTIAVVCRSEYPSARIYGVRRTLDVYRDSLLLAEGWVHRFVGTTFR
jgi:hypothetical protein